MPGRSSSIRRYQNTETLIDTGASARCHGWSFRAERSGVEESCDVTVKVSNGIPRLRSGWRANEPAVLIGFLYSRSEFVRGGNSVPLRQQFPSLSKHKHAEIRSTCLLT